MNIDTGLYARLKAEIQANPERAYNRILEAKLTLKAGSREPVTSCPFHDDRRPSFRVNLEKGTWYCDPCGKGGDPFGLAKELWNLDFKAVIPRLAQLLLPDRNNKGTAPKASARTLRYEIRDLDGELKATHVRKEFADGSKRMWWELPDGTSGLGGLRVADLPLYGISRTIDAADGELVVVCEGEKAADALWERRILVVGTVTGASSIPSADSLKPLLRLHPHLWADNDPGGHDHMERIGRSLIELGAPQVSKIDWKDAPPKGDAADFAGNLEELQALIDSAGELEVEPAEPKPDGKPPALLTEDYEAAVVSNAEYLKRTMIIEKLGPSQGIMLAVGGKHHGKTTTTRTMAMCVMRGLPFLGRATKQGHVIYACSDDEYPTTRMELLRMGWNDKTDPLLLVRINPEGSPDEILSTLAALARKHGSVLIVLDMLFDFARIKDEMSYAGTREAIGKIQQLADDTKALVVATHHSPKYMTDAMTAATAALGSQGIAARFSPIILTRKWADDLYTIDSTTTRDPRGEAIPPTVLNLNDKGWCEPAGPFKSSMKWKIYAPRIMELFEGGEPGLGLSAVTISHDLEISRQSVQNTLYQLFMAGKLQREKKGKGFRYWLPATKEQMFDEIDEMLARKHSGESQD